jgi:hypothetical protein
MLARPEVGTREHILLWLASKPADATYAWADPFECACGKYSREFLTYPTAWCGPGFIPGAPLFELNSIARERANFGELYLVARDKWVEK